LEPPSGPPAPLDPLLIAVPLVPVPLEPLMPLVGATVPLAALPAPEPLPMSEPDEPDVDEPDVDEPNVDEPDVDDPDTLLPELPEEPPAPLLPLGALLLAVPPSVGPGMMVVPP
jgi:hypothetical protein